MVKLVIDKGNSSIKYGVFDKEALIAVYSTPHCDQSQILKTIEKYKAESAIISSVVLNDDFSEIRERVAQVIILDASTRLPFVSEYETPETIGKDRLAAVAGAQALYPGSSVLIIDAGSAITYEVFVDGEIYKGGNISPGLEMRFKALNAFTDKLPLVSKDEEYNFAGRSTRQAIASGVINGMIFEIEGYRESVKQRWGINNTIISGGDSIFFVEKLKKPIFANQNLVLFGLNRILEYNA
ncbi:MAG TPA: type III pantothenate kinase [Marinilabiliaceae bacterium]|nr:type III pantothenate kinase [Marinilabiliaceae bacterium]